MSGQAAGKPSGLRTPHPMRTKMRFSCRLNTPCVQKGREVSGTQYTPAPAIISERTRRKHTSMTLYQMIGLAVLCAMLTLLLKETGGKYTAALVAVGGVGLFLFFLRRLSPVADLLRNYLSDEGMEAVSGLLCKGLAVGYLTQIGGDVCRDLGAEGVAAKLELCGRAELLVLSLPCLRQLLQTALSLLPS